MERREYLATFGAIGLGSLAGCASGSGDGGSETTQDPTTTEEPTPTEAVTTEEPTTEEPTTEETTTTEPASFVVDSYGIPEQVEIGEEVTLSFSVQNTGGQIGSTTVTLYMRTSNSDWQEVTDLTFSDVPPGETATIDTTEPLSFDYIQRYEFRLGQSSKTAVLQTVSANIGWGQEYTTPEEYHIRVDSPNLQQSYEYEDFQGNIAEKEPDTGDKWAFVNVWVKNETGSATFSPLASEFALLYGDSQADGETILLDEPINKGEPFEGGELQPGVERSGWIAYQLPSSVSSGDLSMAWSDETFEGQISVRWGSE